MATDCARTRERISTRATSSSETMARSNDNSGAAPSRTSTRKSSITGGCGARTSLPDVDVTPSGPAGSACDGTLSVLEDRVLAATFDTNDVPSIALDASGAPVALIDQWDGGFRASIARRGDGSDWSVTP